MVNLLLPLSLLRELFLPLSLFLSSPFPFPFSLSHAYLREPGTPFWVAWHRAPACYTREFSHRNGLVGVRGSGRYVACIGCPANIRAKKKGNTRRKDAGISPFQILNFPSSPFTFPTSPPFPPLSFLRRERFLLFPFSTRVENNYIFEKFTKLEKCDYYFIIRLELRLFFEVFLYFLHRFKEEPL